MPFDKGVSGNKKGRPAGAINKASSNLRETITDFLQKNFTKITADFDKLKPHERAKLYTDLLQYGVPKLQSTSLEFDFEKLSDHELDYIIENLKKSINEQE